MEMTFDPSCFLNVLSSGGRGDFLGLSLSQELSCVPRIERGQSGSPLKITEPLTAFPSQAGDPNV